MIVKSCRFCLYACFAIEGGRPAASAYMPSPPSKGLSIAFDCWMRE